MADYNGAAALTCRVRVLEDAGSELRMEQRGVTEVDVRAMLERATRYEPSAAEGRFVIHAIHQQRPWM